MKLLLNYNKTQQRFIDDLIGFNITFDFSNQQWTILTDCGLVMSYGDIDLGQHWGNGLLPNGTKSLPEPMLTDHQQGRQALTWKNTNVNITMTL